MYSSPQFIHRTSTFVPYSPPYTFNHRYSSYAPSVSGYSSDLNERYANASRKHGGDEENNSVCLNDDRLINLHEDQNNNAFDDNNNANNVSMSSKMIAGFNGELFDNAYRAEPKLLLWKFDKRYSPITEEIFGEI